MAADVGADMGRPELALHQLDGAEHRALGTAGAEIGGRAGMSPAAAVAAGLCASIACVRAAIASASTPLGRVSEEGGEPQHQHLGRIFAGARQQALAADAGLDIGAAQLHVDRLLDVVGAALLDHQHRAFARAEVAHLLGTSGNATLST